jgi:transposase InsO family protein
MIGNQLYFQGRDGVLRRTIGKRDISRLLYEFHDGFCGGHFAGRITAEKILQAGYYWPTLFKDAHDYCKSCDVCQAYAQRSTVSGPLHPIPPLGPFEKWGIDLMGPLPMTRRGHRFIIVATDYLTKFAEVRALKSSVKQEVARFLYERVFTRFGAPLEIVSDNGPQFLSEVVENLLARLAVKHRFTTMYKPSTNGLVERTNRTLCSMLAKEAEVHVNICDWDLKIHHVVWVYNTTYKTATGYSPFRLTYGMEALLPIELEVMTLRTATTMRLPLDESQHHRLLQLNELDELQLKAYQSIEVAQAQQKKAFDKKVKRREFEEGDLVMMFDARHHRRAYKKLLPKWFGPFVIRKVFADNGSYELENVDGSPYPDRINHDKLKKILDI